MFDYRQRMLGALLDLKPAHFLTLDWNLQATFALRRGTTKILTKHIVHDLFVVSDVRHLVTVGHLYLDYMLHLICNHEGLEAGRQRQRSFAVRLNELHRRQLVSTEHYQTLRIVNDLRNRFSHEVFFDLSAWNPLDIPILPKDLKLPRRRDLRREFTTLVLRLVLIVLVIEIYRSNPCFILQDVPKHARRRG